MTSKSFHGLTDFFFHESARLLKLCWYPWTICSVHLCYLVLTVSILHEIHEQTGILIHLCKVGKLPLLNYVYVTVLYQGSFWGAILRDSRIFFSKIAFSLLRCENSRNIDMEATGIELDSFRVDFASFQWNLSHDSVWVKPFWFRSVNWHKIDFIFLWRPTISKCPIGGAITAEFYQSSSPYYRYSYG